MGKGPNKPLLVEEIQQKLLLLCLLSFLHLCLLFLVLLHLQHQLLLVLLPQELVLCCAGLQLFLRSTCWSKYIFMSNAL